MTYQAYEALFDPIIKGENKAEIYQDEAFVEYTRLNQRRQKRWNKTGQLSDKVRQFFQRLDREIQVVVITEPWCGDSAHALPFIQKMVELNDRVTLDIQLRDEDSEMDQYLTNGSRSIPMVIFRDQSGKDLGVWGPRPNGATKLRDELLNSVENVVERKTQLQQWYNADKGREIQKEILALLTA